jgi:ATP-dependent RNA helicase DeaD
VGAIAGESGLEGRFIGHIDIRSDHSFVELPAGMPNGILRRLQRVSVCSKELRMSRLGEGGGGGGQSAGDGGPARSGKPPRKSGGKAFGKRTGRPDKSSKGPKGRFSTSATRGKGRSKGGKKGR